MHRVLIPTDLMPVFLAWCMSQGKSLRAMPRYGNGHVVRFRRHKRQYLGANLPNPPEAA